MNYYNNVIVRNNPDTETVSTDLHLCNETFFNKCQNIIYGYALPKIAIKNTARTSNRAENEVVLVNGCWDTSNKIPNIVAEMHNVETINVNSFQNNNSLGDMITGASALTNTTTSRDFFNPSPRDSDSGIESDCTDGNLSWLLNYKINELPPVPDSTTTKDTSYQHMSSSPDFMTRNCKEIKEEQYSHHPSGSKDQNQPYRYAGPKKPPFTYTELIEHALSEKGELTVSGIYQWISEHFPFYKQNDDRWKNSVRHNLSINPHFRKGSKAVHGAGHLWTIAQKDERKSWQLKRQRMQQFIQTYKESECSAEQDAFDIELKAATASILGDTYNTLDHLDNTSKKQDIEVEFINVVDVQNGLEDFLSPPVSKQQIVQECGLGSDFLITSLNPSVLGINITDGEVINDGSFYDDVSLEYYELEKE